MQRRPTGGRCRGADPLLTLAWGKGGSNKISEACREVWNGRSQLQPREVPWLEWERRRLRGLRSTVSKSKSCDFRVRL
ncbi:hypothetical protein E2C01_034700 [Portunus trituberculatus]|uniref:Uncharacterized protein n=1 Tax=Portunus trituberculatus TaxID=210409 RepID=A0A5B7F6D7_PORTR|nr:hypothetical protein [Portunus trituberculatus]